MIKARSPFAHIRKARFQYEFELTAVPISPAQPATPPSTAGEERVAYRCAISFCWGVSRLRDKTSDPRQRLIFRPVLWAVLFLCFGTYWSVAADTQFADPAVLEKQAVDAWKTNRTVSENWQNMASNASAGVRTKSETAFADPGVLEKEAKDAWKTSSATSEKQMAGSSKGNTLALLKTESRFTDPTVLENQARKAWKASPGAPEKQRADSRKANAVPPPAGASTASRIQLTATLSANNDASPKVSATTSPAKADDSWKTVAAQSTSRSNDPPKDLASASPTFTHISQKTRVALSATVTNAPVRIAAAPSPASTNDSLDVFTNSMETLDDTYHLAIGDVVSFRILEDEDDSKKLPVTDSGDLEVPYIGRYPAVGKTCKQLAFEIKAALEKEYYYHATVIIAVDQKTKSRGKVYLVGAVRAPGPEDIPSDEVFTLSKAILRAGGFTDYANEHNVKVTRKNSAGGKDKTFTVNVANILEKGKINEDLTLEPGDLIYVPDRLVRF